MTQPLLPALGAPPPASSATARKVMLGNRSESEIERALRRALHARGLRFRKHLTPEPGMRCRPDVVFTRARVAVFVDGCFWHRCPQHRPLRKQTRRGGDRSSTGTSTVIAAITRNSLNAVGPSCVYGNTNRSTSWSNASSMHFEPADKTADFAPDPFGTSSSSNARRESLASSQ